MPTSHPASPDATPKQAAVLDAIREHIASKGYPPTLHELCDRLGFASKTAPLSHLKALEKKGYIRRDRKAARGIAILDREAAR
jgi:repressor LexA